MSDALLQAALETDPRYNAVVVSGNNTECLNLLHAIDTSGGSAAKVWRVVSGDVVRRLVAPELSALTAEGGVPLTADERERLKVLGDRDGTIDASDTNIRTQFQEILKGRNATLQALKEVAEADPCYCEAFGFATVTLPDLRRIMPSVAKSLHARYLAGTLP